ncbi:UDP-N-acetylmuramoyl-tripeptide--D-alanyl-D-alanine ligase [Thermobifida fusca TM51]|uniref:UDP-N-acetylmuramoyl-tripeptide--D-alanyl-D-alanine ligase n=1 Tax=Thermobifida fusca TM51 TaxID=1169414 RepID=A0A9P2WQS1_THEFU|nr:UDP-N-acetylmuramoyl-tripeptide--D-alanyl-D-alanine ligase [Thermobifida fusca TM51]
MSYGLAPDADVRAEGIALDERGRPRFTLAIGEDTAPVSLRLVGTHQVHNALAVAAVLRELGEPVTAIAAALSEAGPVSRWRMEVTERPDGVTIVNDAYNANPESMSAALRTLATLASGRRAFAVLGHMAELGSAHRTEHERIGRLVTESGVDVLITVGEQAASIADGAASVADWKGETVTVADVTEAVAVLKERLRPKDIVMLKGSRVAGLEQVAEQLIDVEAAE